MSNGIISTHETEREGCVLTVRWRVNHGFKKLGALIKYLDIFEVKYINDNLTMLVKPSKKAFDKYLLN